MFPFFSIHFLLILGSSCQMNLMKKFDVETSKCFCFSPDSHFPTVFLFFYPAQFQPSPHVCLSVCPTVGLSFLIFHLCWCPCISFALSVFDIVLLPVLLSLPVSGSLLCLCSPLTFCHCPCLIPSLSLSVCHSV